MSKIVNILVLLIILLISTQKAIAADFVPGEVIVKFKDSSNLYKAFEEPASSVQGLSSPDSSQKFSSKYNLDKKIFANSKRTKFINVSTVVPVKRQRIEKGILGIKDSNISEVEKVAKITFDKNTSVDSVITELKSDPNVEFAEPNYIFEQFAAVPNDPSFSEQWGMRNVGQGSVLFDVPKGITGNDINILQAWDVKRESPNTQICIIDNGFSGEVADYKNSVWKNPKEIANNGIDDDKNGFIDDTEGWDFVLNQDSAKVGGSGHAYVSMLIISSTQNNNLEMAGISNKANVADISVFGIVNATLENIVAGIKYSADIGCKIDNMSLGTSSNSTTLEDALKYAKSKGVLVVAAAGNSSNNNDSLPTYPASYNLDNIISVASFNSQGQVSSFSNYGPNSVHIAAPGEDIYYYYAGSLYMGGGTSYAAPYVTGVASLVWEKNPTFTYSQVKDAILNGSDTVSTWTSKIQNGRKLNAYKALTYTSSTNYVYDIDGNGKENLTDIILHLGYVLDKPYDARFDYNNDKAVRLTDTLILLARVLK